MRKVILHLMVTLDGCVAGPNGELDWLFEFQDEPRDEYVSALYQSTDGILIGRETYVGMADYWPAAAVDASAKESDRAGARQLNSLPKYVFSKTLDKADWENSQVLRGDVAEEVNRLKQQPGDNLVLTGGFRISQTFIKLGLIDDYQLIVHPVVLGRGNRLFDFDLKEKMPLKFVAATPFSAGIVALHYVKA